jgi:hypothetical protein
VLRGIAQAGDPAHALQDLQAAINEAAWAAPLSAPALPRSTYAGPVSPAWR